MRKLYNRSYSVHRESLKRTLGQTDRMPANFAGRFDNVTLPSTNSVIPIQKDENGNVIRVQVPGTWTVIVKTSDQVKDPRRRFNYSAHRVFVLCQCGKEIPAGRLAQHKPYCKA